MSQTTRRAALDALLKELKMPTIRRECAGLARQAAEETWDYEEFLYHLVEAEVLERQRRCVASRIKAAKFPDEKTFEQLDYEALSGLTRPKLHQLASGDYIGKAEDIVLVGPIGTGKTHVAIALGIEACRQRHRVAFVRAAELVRALVEAKDERRLERMHQHYRKVDVLILDELGFVPFDRHEGELLFNLLTDRYERVSTILTTNLAFSEWVQVFGSEKLTTALLDRLTHHSHILTTRGESYRRRALRDRASQEPLTQGDE